MKYLVELIKDKPAYTKAGDFGSVMSEKSTSGKWQVIFSEFYTGKDIADIMVNEEYLKIHENVSKDRYPKKINGLLKYQTIYIKTIIHLNAKSEIFLLYLYKIFKLCYNKIEVI